MRFKFVGTLINVKESRGKNYCIRKNLPIHVCMLSSWPDLFLLLPRKGFGKKLMNPDKFSQDTTIELLHCH